MIRKRTLILLAMIFCVWAIMATGLAGYYHEKYVSITEAFEQMEGAIVKVDVLIDYGNDSRIWHNSTIVMAGSSPLDALLTITKNVEFERFNGKYVTSIDGKVQGDNSGWTWWFWNTEKSDWDYSLEAIDEYVLRPEEIIKFHFVSW